MFYREGLSRSECCIPGCLRGWKHRGSYVRKHQRVYLFDLDCFDYFAKYMKRKTQNQMKGIRRTLKHKQKREKQQKDCKVIGYQFQSRWRSIAGCRLLLRTLITRLRRENAWFHVLQRTYKRDDEISSLFLNLDTALRSSTLGWLTHIWQSELSWNNRD